MGTRDTSREAVAFLLGRLSPGVQRRVEVRLLRDPQYFAEMCAAEDDVLTRYLQGSLTPEERRGLEATFLSTPRGARRLAEARGRH